MASGPTPGQNAQRLQPVVSPGPARLAKRRLTLAYRFSIALTVVAAATCSICVFHSQVFRDPAWTIGNAQGTALVILVVAVPTVVVSMILSARGSLRAQMTWLGGLAYILYNAIFFAYGIHFNSLFLLFTTMLGLAFWSVVTLLWAVDVEELKAHFAPSTPVRAFAGFLALINAPFVLLWLKDIVPGILANAAPAGLHGTGMITNPVEVTDFAFSFSLIALAVIWLWQRRPWGYLLVGALLVYGVIEAISIATDQFFGHLHDTSQSAAAVPLFALIAVIVLVPTILFLRNLRQESMTDLSVPHSREIGPPPDGGSKASGVW